MLPPNGFLSAELKKIILIGCGTAYHSCYTAKYWLEELTSIPIEIDIASEFRYRKIQFNKKNLYIFVSQSCETADTFAALELCKKNKVKTHLKTNIYKTIQKARLRNLKVVLNYEGPLKAPIIENQKVGEVKIYYKENKEWSKVC